MKAIATIAFWCLLVRAAVADETRPALRGVWIEVVDDRATLVEVDFAGEHLVLPVSSRHATWAPSRVMTMGIKNAIVVRVWAGAEIVCTVTHEITTEERIAGQVVTRGGCIASARLTFAPRPANERSGRASLDLSHVPILARSPTGYLAMMLGTVASIATHTVIGAEVGVALPGAPWLFGHARGATGAPIGLPGTCGPSGRRLDMRLGLGAHACNDTACGFVSLDAGYYGERLRSGSEMCPSVPPRDERGVTWGARLGGDLGSGAAGLRVTLEGFGTPDNTLGFVVSFGIVFHTSQDPRAVARRRRNAIALADGAADCRRIVQARAELARDDRPFHDALTRHPFVADCLQREQAERTSRARAADEQARAAKRRVQVEQAEREHDRRHGYERCHAQRVEILRRVNQLTDAKERGRLIATLPRCE